MELATIITSGLLALLTLVGLVIAGLGQRAVGKRYAKDEARRERELGKFAEQRRESDQRYRAAEARRDVEQVARDADRRDDEQRQARLIRMREIGSVDRPDDQRKPWEPPTQLAFEVTNHSTSPIFNVRLIASFSKEQTPTGNATGQGDFEDHAEVVEAGGMHRVHVWIDTQGTKLTNPSPLVTVGFTDARGREWKIARQGKFIHRVPHMGWPQGPLSLERVNSMGDMYDEDGPTKAQGSTSV